MKTQQKTHPFNIKQQNGKNKIFFGKNETIAQLNSDKSQLRQEKNNAKQWRILRNLTKNHI